MNRTQALQEKPLDTIYELLAELGLSYEREHRELDATKAARPDLTERGEAYLKRNSFISE